MVTIEFGSVLRLLKLPLRENFGQFFSGFFLVQMIYLRAMVIRLCLPSRSVLRILQVNRSRLPILKVRKSKHICTVYSRTSLIRTPKGQSKVSLSERCPFYRGHYDDVNFKLPLTVLKCLVPKTGTHMHLIFINIQYSDTVLQENETNYNSML